MDTAGTNGNANKYERRMKAMRHLLELTDKTK
jgi:hypothetical protein